MKCLIIINKEVKDTSFQGENMSYGQNFAYSKTREQDIALMLAANVGLRLVSHLTTYRPTLAHKTAPT